MIGQGNKTYAAAAFECLFSSQIGSGAKVYFAGYVWRSADPSYRGEWNGHTLTFRKKAKVRALMETLNVKTVGLSEAERAKVSKDLKREGVEPKGKVDFGGALRRSIEGE